MVYHVGVLVFPILLIGILALVYLGRGISVFLGVLLTLMWQGSSLLGLGRAGSARFGSNRRRGQRGSR